jgi:hypothetical protein
VRDALEGLTELLVAVVLVEGGVADHTQVEGAAVEVDHLPLHPHEGFHLGGEVGDGAVVGPRRVELVGHADLTGPGGGGGPPIQVPTDVEVALGEPAGDEGVGGGEHAGRVVTGREPGA